MDNKAIIAKIQAGLKGCSEKFSIPAKDVQILIKSNGKVDLMNADIFITELDVLKVFKISMMENLLFPIVPYLKKTIALWAIKKNISTDFITARIFTKQADFYPCVYLHDGLKVVCEITINELLQ